MPLVERQRILVVEGKQDLGFFQALLQRMQIDTVQILPIGGKNSLRANLKALKNAPGFNLVTQLGIIRDADADYGAAFQSVCDSLRAAGLEAPARTCLKCGTSPVVSVFIIPDGRTGELEDVCLQAIANDPACACVEGYFQCLASIHTAPQKLSKAKVQVFLASRPEPDKRLGEAALAGYWPLDHAAFNTLRDFLADLFH